MTDSQQPERVYALLVETNPVPDPEQAREIIDRRRGRLSLVRPRRHDMTDRKVAPQRPRWMIPVGAAAAVILFVGAMMLFSGSDEEPQVATTLAPTTTTVAPTTTTAAPTTTVPSAVPIDPDVLVGTWDNPRDRIEVTFDADGTMAYSLVGSADVFETGTWTLEGNRLTMTSEGGTDPNCLESGPGAYDLTLAEGVGVDSGEGLQLTATWVEDSCSERVQAWGWFWTRIVPFDADSILGDWLLDFGQGQWVWTFNPDGTYTMIQAFNAVQGEIGTYTLVGNRITLVGDPEATPGDQFGAECTADPGVYDVTVSPDGEALAFAWVSDNCARRANLTFGLPRYEG
jgi:hypothetical protein